MGRRRVAGLALVLGGVMVLAACAGGGTASDATPPPGGSAAGASTPAPRPAEAPDCAPPGATAATVGAQDDPVLVVTLGTGDHGVVLAPQNQARACQWAQEMTRLADQGYAVASFDWPRDATAAIPAAVGVLRDAGATEVALVGASKGGAFAAAQADELEPAPVAVVALGPPAEFGVDARSSASDYRGPLLVVASTDDSSVDVAESAEVARADDPATFVELPGSAHGVALFDGEHREAVQTLIDDLLREAFAG